LQRGWDWLLHDVHILGTMYGREPVHGKLLRAEAKRITLRQHQRLHLGDLRRRSLLQFDLHWPVRGL
jgi:hypothetical protein